MEHNIKTVAIIQARMASTRLPGKVMLPISDRPMLAYSLDRVAAAKTLDDLVVATTKASEDSQVAKLAKDSGYGVYRGSENDVLDRFFEAARRFQAQTVVRITADCPLIDPDLIDLIVNAFFENKVDYASNVSPPTFPDGLDVEVFTFKALQIAHKDATRAFEREHVTPYIRDSGHFSCFNVTHSADLSANRWTVDEPEDLEVVRQVFSDFYPETRFGWQEVLSLVQTKPDIFRLNQHIGRNEGSQMNKGQKLWRRAKRVIPGGNMLLSKRPEMFLPNQWPTYFAKAKGCSVWDLDGNKYIDMSLMGVGTNVLGYSCQYVDDAVKSAITDGNLSTLNCSEEVHLAERLLDIHPWAQMVRLARTGGEANAIAVRLARAASGRDKVAVCGYHGWHDWYLAANLAGENLQGHLLPGLDPIGVPKVLHDTTVTFRYNDIEELNTLITGHPDIGTIKMEVARNEVPERGFLNKVRDLATANNIVLIFDECSSGFRQNFGGLHKVYGVEPDVAVFGKTLGNGYAITAVLGKQDIMDHAQTSFISSTFWTERIGPTAAIATLEEMEQTQSGEYVRRTGEDLKAKWQLLAAKHSLPIRQWGLPGLQGFTFDMEEPDVLKTLTTQEMLRQGYLANNTVYVSTAHTPEIIAEYLEALEIAFETVAKCSNKEDALDLLNGPVCHSGFKRLN